MRYDYYSLINGSVFATALIFVCDYLEATMTFLIALLLGFTFNIFAGLKADKVGFSMWRLYNFKGYKLKDSLIELVLIVVIVYFLKLIIELMELGNGSTEMVRWLIFVALYYYVNNGLKNLSFAYPKNTWIKFISNLLSFKFKHLLPEALLSSWEKAKKETEKKKKVKKEKSEV